LIKTAALLLLTCGVLTHALAGVIPVTTVNNSNSWTTQWSDGTVTYSGNPFNVFSPDFTDVSITKTSYFPANPGDLLGGAAGLGNWNGVWVSTFSFFLPQGTSNFSLNLNTLFTDDKLVFFLNGTPVADRLVQGASAGPGMLNSSLTGNTNTAYTFANQSSYTINNQALFLVGQLNTLVAIVNNTGAPSAMSTARTLAAPTQDRTAFRVEGLVVFTDPVPEPATVSLIGGGLLAVALLGRRKR
jgi:hypothetical protein